MEGEPILPARRGAP